VGYFETVTLFRLHEFASRVDRLELELGFFWAVLYVIWNRTGSRS